MLSVHSLVQAETTRTFFSPVQRGDSFGQGIGDPGVDTKSPILETIRDCLENLPYWTAKFEACMQIPVGQLKRSTMQ